MGCWSFPNNEDKLNLFKSLMSKEFKLGDRDKLYSVFGDDELYDLLDDIESDYPEDYKDIDVRPTIVSRMQSMLSQGKSTFINMPDNIFDELLNFVDHIEEKLNKKTGEYNA